MPVIYLDRVIVLNTIIDYLLLLTTAQILGCPLKRLRFFIIAVLGGIYAAAVLLIPWLNQPICRISIGILITVIAYIGLVTLWRATALFLLLSGSLAGILYGIGFAMGKPYAVLSNISSGSINWLLLIGATGIFYLLLEILFRQSAKFGRGELMDIKITLAGKSCTVRTLRDTGNTLRNPVDGSSVLVIEADALASIWKPPTEAILSAAIPPEEKLTQLYAQGHTNFSLVPYQSIGEDQGLLLAVRSDYIQIGRRICPKALLALSPYPIGNGIYHGLWGGMEYATNSL